MSTVNLQALS